MHRPTRTLTASSHPAVHVYACRHVFKHKKNARTTKNTHTLVHIPMQLATMRPPVNPVCAVHLVYIVLQANTPCVNATAGYSDNIIHIGLTCSIFCNLAYLIHVVVQINTPCQRHRRGHRQEPEAHLLECACLTVFPGRTNRRPLAPFHPILFHQGNSILRRPCTRAATVGAHLHRM